MLSDAIHSMRERLSSTTLDHHDVHRIVQELRWFELEARNLEGRVEIATGRPHVALDGCLVSAPSFETEASHAG